MDNPSPTVWELHKDADALLHSRQNSFFVAQAFLVTGFGTIAAAVSADKRVLVYMAVVIAAIGMLVSLAYWAMAIVHAPRLLRMKQLLMVHEAYRLYLQPGRNMPFDEFRTIEINGSEQLKATWVAQAVSIWVPLLCAALWAVMMLFAFRL